MDFKETENSDQWMNVHAVYMLYKMCKNWYSFVSLCETDDRFVSQFLDFNVPSSMQDDLRIKVLVIAWF